MQQKMSILEIGSIGYILGKCPVLIISERFPDGTRNVVYLRKILGNQMGGVHKRPDPKNPRDVCRRKSITRNPYPLRYKVTSQELKLADELAEEYLNKGKTGPDRCIPSITGVFS